MARRHGKFLRCMTLLGLLAMLLGAGRTGAQDNGWQVTGFAETRQGAQVRSPGKLLTSLSKLRGEVTGGIAGSVLHASANALYNPLYGQPLRVELREVYIGHQWAHWGFRAGRQLVIWGMADGVRVTDLVSPMDMREFLAQDYDEIRQPVNAVRVFGYNDWARIELLCVPLFEGFILPTARANPWSVLPEDTPSPLVWQEAGSVPERKLANMEYGGRLAFTLPGVDFAFSGLYTWNKMPVLSYTPSATHIAVRPHYYRMGFAGAEIAKPVGNFVLRGEAAYSMDKPQAFRPSEKPRGAKGFNTLHWLVGVDWYGPWEWMVSAQFASETILGYEAGLNAPEHSKLTTLHISKQLLGNTLQIASMTYYDWQDKGWFSRFSADYSVDDHLRLGLGFDWLEGEAGLFKAYRKNSSGWVRARYYF